MGHFSTKACARSICLLKLYWRESCTEFNNISYQEANEIEKNEYDTKISLKVTLHSIFGAKKMPNFH